MKCRYFGTSAALLALFAFASVHADDTTQGFGVGGAVTSGADHAGNIPLGLGFGVGYFMHHEDNGHYSNIQGLAEFDPLFPSSGLDLHGEFGWKIPNAALGACPLTYGLMSQTHAYAGTLAALTNPNSPVGVSSSGSYAMMGQASQTTGATAGVLCPLGSENEYILFNAIAAVPMRLGAYDNGVSVAAGGGVTLATGPTLVSASYTAPIAGTGHSASQDFGLAAAFTIGSVYTGLQATLNDGPDAKSVPGWFPVAGNVSVIVGGSMDLH